MHNIYKENVKTLLKNSKENEYNSMSHSSIRRDSITEIEETDVNLQIPCDLIKIPREVYSRVYVA